MSAPRIPRRRRPASLVEVMAMLVVVAFVSAGVALAFGTCAGGRP